MTVGVFYNLSQKTGISTKQFTWLYLYPIPSCPKSRLSTAPHRGRSNSPGSYHWPPRHFYGCCCPCLFIQSIYIVLRCKHATQLKSYSLTELVVIFPGTFKHESSCFPSCISIKRCSWGLSPAPVQFPRMKEYYSNDTHTRFQFSCPD